MWNFQDGAFGDDEIIGHGKRGEKASNGSGDAAADQIAVDGLLGDLFGEEDAEARDFAVWGGRGWWSEILRLAVFAQNDGRGDNKGDILGVKGFSLSADAVSFEAEREPILPGESHILN